MTENTAISALTDEQAEERTEEILEALRDVVDPELGINVVDLGLIYGVTLDGLNKITLDMTLTSAACPLTEMIEEQTGEALKDVVDDFTINWVWMPRGAPRRSPTTVGSSTAHSASTSDTSAPKGPDHKVRAFRVPAPAVSGEPLPSAKFMPPP